MFRDTLHTPTWSISPGCLMVLGKSRVGVNEEDLHLHRREHATRQGQSEEALAVPPPVPLHQPDVQLHMARSSVRHAMDVSFLPP